MDCFACRPLLVSVGQCGLQSIDSYVDFTRTGWRANIRPQIVLDAGIPLSQWPVWKSPIYGVRYWSMVCVHNSTQQNDCACFCLPSETRRYGIGYAEETDRTVCSRNNVHSWWGQTLALYLFQHGLHMQEGGFG